MSCIKSMNGEEVDFTHYKFGVVKRYEDFRQNQFCQWMLYVVNENGSLPYPELVARARQTLDFSDNTVLSAIGLNQDLGEQGLVEQSLQQLFERGWMDGSGCCFTDFCRAKAAPAAYADVVASLW